MPSSSPAATARSAPSSSRPRWTPSAPSRKRRLDVVVDDEERVEPARSPGPPRPARPCSQPLRRSWTTVAPPSTAARAAARSSTIACSLTPSFGARVERLRVEVVERVVERDVERAGALRLPAASSPATPNATSASAAAASGSSPRTPRKQPVIAVAMQPVPVTVPSSSCPLATACTVEPSETWSTGPVTATTHAQLARGLAGQLGPACLADRLDAADLGLAAGERRDLGRVAAHDRDLQLRRAAAARSRCGRSSRPRRPGRAPPARRRGSRPGRRAASTRPRRRRACRC